MNVDIDTYLTSWAIYRIDCELRIRNRAKINADGWRKLRQFHLEQYINREESPFAFMFALKFKHQRIFKQISSANEIYKVSLQKRQTIFQEKLYGRG